jgi:Cu/Ag efflux protein CusF
VTALALALAAMLAFSQAPAVQPAKPGTYRGSGVVVAIDRDMNRVTIEAEPVEALKLPALALAFIVYDERVWSRVPRGKRVDFEFMKQGNNYVLLRVLKPVP